LRPLNHDVLPVTATTLLTPAMAGLLDRIRRAQRVPFHAMTPAEARAAYDKAGEVLEPPRAPLARVQDLTVPATDGTPLPARLYAPSHDRLPVLLYLHGGGFVIGGLETHDSLCRQLALRSGCAVLALDYRLAPEHRFPTAVDDTWAALHWLAGPGAAALGLDGSRIAVGGDSAGGTLATVAALHARDTGLPLALQLLITPAPPPTRTRPRTGCSPTASCWTRPVITWFLQSIRAQPPPTARDWRFAPLLAPDFSTWTAWRRPGCCLAECDPLVDEGIAVWRRGCAWLPVWRWIWSWYRGMTHEFIKMGRAIPEAKRAHADAARALRQAFHLT
jgi:acetyl esterase